MAEDLKPRKEIQKQLNQNQEPSAILTQLDQQYDFTLETYCQQLEIILGKYPFANFAPKIRKFLQEHALSAYYHIWDPNDMDAEEKAQENNEAYLYKKFERLKKSPLSPRVRLIFSGIGGILYLLFLLFMVLNPSLLLTREGWSLFCCSTTPMGILFWDIQRITHFQNALLKVIIAKKNKWIFSDYPDQRRLSRMQYRFPELFYKGYGKRHFRDQFWGKIRFQHHRVDFWSGLFCYRGHLGGYHQETVMAFRLRNRLKTELVLHPETSVSRAKNFLTHSDFDTESIEFNDFFTVIHQGLKLEAQSKILRILSPSVQKRLIELMASGFRFSVVFRERMVLFIVEGSFLEQTQTNFFQHLEIVEADGQEFEEKMKRLLQLTSEIVPFLE